MISTPVSRFPRGLLSVFDVKSTGDYPKFFDGTYGLPFDITRLQIDNNREDFYDLTTLLNGAGTQDAGSFILSNVGGSTVPDNECWLVSVASLHVGLTGVGVSAHMPLLGYQQQGVTGDSGFIPLGNPSAAPELITGVATLQLRQTTQQLQTPYHVMPSGARLIVQNPSRATGAVGGTILWYTYLRFLRCRL